MEIYLTSNKSEPKEFNAGIKFKNGKFREIKSITDITTFLRSDLNQKFLYLDNTYWLNVSQIPLDKIESIVIDFNKF